MQTLAGHVGDVRALRFSADGRRLLSAGRDFTLRVWDVESGHELHSFSWTRDALRSLAVSESGRLAITGADDGSIKVFDFGYVAAYEALAGRLGGTLAALRAEPDDPGALRFLGAWYAFRGVSGWAMDLLGRAEAEGATVSPLMLARCHWRAGDYAAARRELQRAREKDGGAAAQFLIATIGHADQGRRLSQLSVKDGRVRFPFLGLRAQEAPGGALVTGILDGTPARRAGLRPGDLIVRADDQPIGGAEPLGRYSRRCPRARPWRSATCATACKGGPSRSWRSARAACGSRTRSKSASPAAVTRCRR